MSQRTRRIAVLHLLADEMWHSTSEICRVDVGGSEGTRRLRELRNEVRRGLHPGYADIEKQKSPVTGSTQYVYRLVPAPVADKHGQTNLF